MLNRLHWSFFPTETRRLVTSARDPRNIQFGLKLSF
jgi:hypothetical protein